MGQRYLVSEVVKGMWYWVVVNGGWLVPGVEKEGVGF